VNLPERVSVGPAIVNTAQGVADRAFEKQADKRTQEAMIAAAALNFERDVDGNLSAPTLPIGENGLLAPSIYDRAYTKMVGQRYTQQLQIDTTSRISAIANKFILDPSGFAEVAGEYVAKVTELAPDMLKPTVNMNAQKVMVEHHNRISRDLAERDWTDARNTQIATIDKIEDELASYLVAGDTEAALDKYIEFEAGLIDGMGPNFWADAYPAARRAALQSKVVQAQIVGDITRLPNDSVVMADAVQQLIDFKDGEGNVHIIRDGQVVEVPVTEAMPDENERRILSTNGITAINARESAFKNTTNTRHLRQYKEFEQWFTPYVSTLEAAGGKAEIPKLMDWFWRADATDNQDLKDRIRAEINRAVTTGGSQGTQFDRNVSRQFQRMQEKQIISRQNFADKMGVERFDLLPPDLREQYRMSEPALLGVFNLPQTKESAEKAIDLYKGFGPEIVWESEVQGGSDIETLKRHINLGMQQLGIVDLDAINYFGNVLGNIETASGNEVVRMLSIFDEMRDTPNLRGKLKSAFGEANFAALNFMTDNMMPSQMADSAYLTDVVQQAKEGKLFDSWSLLDKDDKITLEDRLDKSLQNYNDPWFGFEGAGLPPELRMEARSMLPGAINGLGANPSDKALRSVADGIVDELLTSADSRWRRSTLGLNHDKARAFGQHGPDLFVGSRIAVPASKQPGTGIAEYPPEFFYPSSELIEDAVTPHFQKVLNLMQSEVPLWAGKNAHLRYNAGRSALTGRREYEIYVSIKGGDPEQVTTNGFFVGEPVYISFDEAVAEYKAGIIKQEEIDQEGRIRRQEEIDAMPMVPNDRGI
jgi:hypothetical protein